MERVYYDPFGSRLQGYRLGVFDETGLQEQTRRARTADYDFNNFMPLRLAQARRQDQFESAALPYNITNLGLAQRQLAGNVFDTEQKNNSLIGSTTGDYSPYLANAYTYGNGVSTFANGPTQPLFHALAYNILNNKPTTFGEDFIRSFGVTPQQWQAELGKTTGQMRSGQDTSIDQYYGFPRALQIQEAQRLQNAQDWGYQVQQQEANARNLNNMIQMGYLTGKYGGGLPAQYNQYGIPQNTAQGEPDDTTDISGYPSGYSGDYFEQ